MNLKISTGKLKNQMPQFIRTFLYVPRTLLVEPEGHGRRAFMHEIGMRTVARHASIAQLVNTSKSMKMPKYFYTANLRIEAVHSFHDL